MRLKATPLLLIMACALTLAACEKKTKDAQADAVRDTSAAAGAEMDKKADAVSDQGEVTGDAIQKQADQGADAMHEKADAVRDRGERQADAIESGKIGATTKTDQITTTTKPTKK
ncbi:MAG: hypothetical protein WCO82_00105 [Sphingomonadales bacterium]|jgi:hypothetical protein